MSIPENTTIVADAAAAHPLKITEISIHLCNNGAPQNSLVGFARVVLNGAFVVNSIRIVAGRFGPFISFPRDIDKVKKKTFDICFPIKSTLMDSMTADIVTAYKTAVFNAAQARATQESEAHA